MQLFVEKGLRGGISMITQRYAKANNTYIPEYDSSQPNNHVTYLDANNLYEWAMSHALPVAELRRLEKEECKHLNTNYVSDDSEGGFILEMDLDYPPELPDLHNEYPLAPEKMKVTENMLSPYAKKFLEDIDLKGASTEKLIPNIHSKEIYVVHYINLKLYLSLRMRLTRIHGVMTCKQQPWLKTYTDFNTQQRKMERTDFEKDFFLN